MATTTRRAARRNRVLETRIANTPAGGYVRDGLIVPADGRLERNNLSTNTVLPEASGNTSARVPEGAPLTGLELMPGERPDQTVTITIDLLDMAPSTTPIILNLFDKSGYRKKKAPYLNPAGAIYIGSGDINLYQPFVDELCPEAFHFDMIMMQVVKADGVIIPIETQFSQIITVHKDKVNKHREFALKPAHYVEPANQDKSVRRLIFTGEGTRVDRNTTWGVLVYPGFKVDFHIFTAATTRD